MHHLALAAMVGALLASHAWTQPASTTAVSAGLSPVVRIDSGVSGHIHPALCISKKGVLVAVYCKSEYQPYLITRSTDGGKTWSKPSLFPHTIKTQVYPGSLTTLADGRLVHAWNVWFSLGEKARSRHVAYSTSSDDGLTWSEPKALAKNKDPKIESVIRHPMVELGPTAWLLPLADRTVLYNPQTGEETPFGDGRNHGLVPMARTAKGSLVSGKGLRSTDGGKTWHAVKPFPDVHSQGWRHQMIALKNGPLLASQILGPGFGGERINFIVSRDDGQSWDLDHPVEFYDPGRAIGGRACPRTVEIDEQTLGTIFYDIEAKQPGGSGVFFRTMATSRLDPPGQGPQAGAAKAPADPFARANLVAWCIVPFDSKNRTPAERAEMVKRLGLRRVAYDWRDQHVASFEDEILQYKKHGLEYFAFWSVHDRAFELFAKHDLHPQIWQTAPSPAGETAEARVAASMKQLLPLVQRTSRMKCRLGLYNHGGWGGEPENLVAVCKALRAQHAADHVGIVYNLHHGHDQIRDFAKALAVMQPYLLCLNLNGMTTDGDKKGLKILPLGAGEHDLSLLKTIRASGYTGPIGIIGHTNDDVEERLQDNLDGLDWLVARLNGKEPGPRPAFRTYGKR
jgi:hypothetical protein